MIRWIVLLHVLGACIWVGGHLLLLLRYLPPALKSKDAAGILAFEKKFEPLGIPALLLQVITGIILGLHYNAAWFRFDSHFSAVFNLKLILLLLTVVLAVHARFFIIPRLNERNLGLLAGHILAVTVLAVGFVYLGISFRYGFS